MNKTYQEWSKKSIDEQTKIIRNEELFDQEVAGVLGELAWIHPDDPQYQIIIGNLNTLVNARVNYLRPDLDQKKIAVDLQKAETEMIKAEIELGKLDVERERVAVEAEKVKVEAKKVEIDQKKIEEERRKLFNQIICECIKLLPRVIGIVGAIGMTKMWFCIEQDRTVNQRLINRMIDWFAKS